PRPHPRTPPGRRRPSARAPRACRRPLPGIGARDPRPQREARSPPPRTHARATGSLSVRERARSPLRVIVEAATRLPAEAPGRDVLAEQRTGLEPVLAEPVADHLHDRDA